MGRALWQRRIDTLHGPAVFDAQLAADTLAEAEAALRAGDASRAEATYLRTLGKLGPFSDPAWQTDRATDQRTRSQCHARLAALAFDQRDYERSLRQTAAAAAARREAIALDRCDDDDVRFMITALVHAATVHERVGDLDEARHSCRVALEFADYADDHGSEARDARTRRSIESARRAATRLLDELERRVDAGETPSTRASGPNGSDDLAPGGGRVDLSSLYESPSVEISPIDLRELGVETEQLVPAPDLEPVDLAEIRPEVILDLTDAEVVIDLTEPGPTDATAALDAADTPEDDRGDDLDLRDDELTPVDARFDRRPDHHRARQAARRAERERPGTAHDVATTHGAPDRDDAGDQTDDSGHLAEPAATLLAQARGHAFTARQLRAQDEGAAAIHAHRAVRTATRARPWAKHDEQVTIEVALTLVDALVTRSDVLAMAGNDEVSLTDLRRARTVADHLWRACPTPRTATAAVLVSVRSAARGWGRDGEAETAAHLEQAAMIIVDADALGVTLPDGVVTFEPPVGAIGERDALLAFGDQLFEVLQAPAPTQGSPATTDTAVAAV